jgi:hypothetical protein
MTNLSHNIFFTQKKMTHLQSGKDFPIQVFDDKITFLLNGVNYKLPDSEFNKIKKTRSGFFKTETTFTDCSLSIGVYKIDFKTLEQTNLFSGFKRRIYGE